MAKSNKKIGISLLLVTTFLITACDENDMVGPVVVDAYFSSTPAEERGGGGE